MGSCNHQYRVPRHCQMQMIHPLKSPPASTSLVHPSAAWPSAMTSSSKQAATQFKCCTDQLLQLVPNAQPIMQHSLLVLPPGSHPLLTCSSATDLITPTPSQRSATCINKIPTHRHLHSSTTSWQPPHTSFATLPTRPNLFQPRPSSSRLPPSSHRRGCIRCSRGW